VYLPGARLLNANAPSRWGYAIAAAFSSTTIHERTLGKRWSFTSYLPGPGTFHCRTEALFISAD
jgi:hypothetical protein